MTTPDPVLASKVARAELMKRVLIVVTTVLVTAILIVELALLGQVRKTQLEGTPVGNKLVASADRILDCTDPQGECYQQGQKRTGDAVASIQRIIVLSAACSLEVPPDETVAQRVADITACVNRGLKQP